MEPKKRCTTTLLTVVEEDDILYFPLVNVLSKLELFCNRIRLINIIFFNFLDVPVKRTLYPFFHSNRSRFFNMETLYTQSLVGILNGLGNEYPKLNRATELSDAAKTADQSYVRWEANGGVDLQLPSFKLTNRQMFWLCLMHVFSKKFDKKAAQEVGENFRLESDNLNDRVKLIPGFKEAFRCGKKS